MGVLRALAITQLFPNAVEPLFSPFNRQQFSALSKLCDLSVIAPVPWFPAAGAIAGGTRAGRLADLPKRGRVDDLDVANPRFLHVPKVGHWFSGPLYAAGLLPHVRKYRGKVDVVLGAWAYPDGWAAIALAKLLGVPAVIKLHGSDINVVAKMRGPRMWLRSLLPSAERVIAVSRRLGQEAVALGVDEQRVEVVFNGVDQSRFSPGDRGAARAALGVAKERRQILFVGNLLKSKGVADLLAAFENIAAKDELLDLALVGDGPQRAACEQLAARMPGRVRVAGAVPLSQVAQWMTACDVLSLPSWNEGTPNVVLEALSAGRRVVASDVGGIPDLLCTPELGEMVAARDRTQLAGALARAAGQKYDPAEVARLGGRGDWQQSARDLYAVLARAAAHPVSFEEPNLGQTAKSA